MMELAMRTMLIKVSHLLTVDDVEKIKYMCKDFMPLRIRAEIKDSINLFHQLEQRGKFKYNDVSFIEHLLKNVCADRPEVLEEFAAYSQSKGYIAITDFEHGSSLNPVQWDGAEPLSSYGYPNIISRSDWGAQAPVAVSYLTHNQPLPYVIIQHSADSQCHDRLSCITRTKSYQAFHMNDKGWHDIGYSFVIGGDGSVLEARGWDCEGAHTYGYNDKSLGICFIGNFQSNRPKQVQIEAAHNLIEYGISLGKISPDYKLLGHRDVRPTSSPGDKLYAIIKEWPNFSHNLKC